MVPRQSTVVPNTSKVSALMSPCCIGKEPPGHRTDRARRPGLDPTTDLSWTDRVDPAAWSLPNTRSTYASQRDGLTVAARAHAQDRPQGLRGPREPLSAGVGRESLTRSSPARPRADKTPVLRHCSAPKTHADRRLAARYCTRRERQARHPQPRPGRDSPTRPSVFLNAPSRPALSLVRRQPRPPLPSPGGQRTGATLAVPYRANQSSNRVVPMMAPSPGLSPRSSNAAPK